MADETDIFVPAMVLLTITPTILDAIKQYQDRFSEPSTDHVSAPDESSLDDVEVGEPISHGQVIDISRNLIERVTDTTREGNHQRRLYNCDVEKFHLDHLLRGSSVYVAPAKPKPEQVSSRSRKVPATGPDADDRSRPANTRR